MAESKVKETTAESVFRGPGVTVVDGTVVFSRGAVGETLDQDQARGRLKSCGIARMGFAVKYEDYAEGMLDA